MRGNLARSLLHNLIDIVQDTFGCNVSIDTTARSRGGGLGFAVAVLGQMETPLPAGHLLANRWLRLLRLVAWFFC